MTPMAEMIEEIQDIMLNLFEILLNSILFPQKLGLPHTMCFINNETSDMAFVVQSHHNVLESG